MPVPDQDLAAANEKLRLVGAPHWHRAELSQVNELVDGLCDELVAGGNWIPHKEPHRRLEPYPQIRHYLFTYLGSVIARIRGSEAQRWLDRGLALLVLEDSRPDYRDSFARAEALFEAG